MSAHYRRLSLGQGLSLCIFGVLAGLAFLIASLRIRYLPAQILLLFGSWLFLVFFSHDLAHHVAGGIVGIDFRYYFLGRSGITKLHLPVISGLAQKVPVLVLKVEKKSLKHLSRNRVSLMYLSGVVASMLASFLVLPAAYSITLIVGILFTVLTLANFLFTVYFSTRAGDIHRARSARDILVSRSEPQYRRGRLVSLHYPSETTT